MKSNKLNGTMVAETTSKNGARLKKLVVFCTFCFLFATCLFAGNTETRYYKQIKIVTKDRKEQSGSGSGQFITFNDKGCYDSDKSGYTVNNGFLKFGKETTDRVYYSGNSYWGEAMYIFTENYGRLNIVVEENGTTYVYVLAPPPANVYTCALIKETTPNPINSAKPVNSVIVNPVAPITATGTTSTSSTPKSKQKYVTKEESCPQCHGSGLCSTCNGKGLVISTYTQKWAPCPNCTNGKCTRCGGSGKILRGEWITVYE